MNDELKSAADIAKDPSSYSVITYLWVLIISMWGGVVRIVLDLRRGTKSVKQAFLFFIGEMSVSGFAGVLTFFLFESFGVQPLYTAVMTGIAGYMGGRAVSGFEAIYKAARTGQPNADGR